MIKGDHGMIKAQCTEEILIVVVETRDSRVSTNDYYVSQIIAPMEGRSH